jgi:1,4-alpha-glucan branching enzyme
MRKNGRHKTNGNGKTTSVLRVEFSHPTAVAVAIAGSFNDWRPEATQMVTLGDGRWIKEVVLPPGTYEYCLVVDGHWMPDPLARETVPNPFGGLNSVVHVSNGAANKSGEIRPDSQTK